MTHRFIEPVAAIKLLTQSRKRTVSNSAAQKRGTSGGLFWIAIGFLSTQKFLIPDLYALVCIVPFCLALISRSTERRTALFVLAVCFSIDNSHDYLPGTASFVRYILYVTPLALLLLNRRFDPAALFICSAAIIYFSLKAAFQPHVFAVDHFIRDIITIFVLCLALCSRALNIDDVNAFIGSLVPATSGILFGELINIFAFNDIWYGDYLSYSSTRWMALIPVLYGIHNRRLWAFIPVYAAAFFVVSAFGSRTLTLALLFGVLAIWAKGTKLGVGASIIPVGVAIFTLPWLTQIPAIAQFAAGSKTLNMFLIIGGGVEGQGLGDYLRVLDPVRYYEHLAFVSRPLTEIIFGSGFGIGFDDAGGIFGDLRVGGFAFSDKELQENVFYRFHDLWTSLGWRVGLFPMCAFFIALYRRPKQEAHILVTTIATVSIFCSYYSPAGVVVSAIFVAVVMGCKNERITDEIETG